MKRVALSGGTLLVSQVCIRLTISSGSPTIFSRFSSRSTLTMLNAELRSKLAMIVYWFESRALSIYDWSSNPAV